MQRFVRLLDDGSGDLLIVCVDDPLSTPIPAHRAFLLGASESLRTLLSLQTEGYGTSTYPDPAAHGSRATSRLLLHGVRGDTMRSVLRHIYTGHTLIDSSNALDLCLAAEKFGLEYLRESAELFMPRLLRDDNVAFVLTAAAECVYIWRGGGYTIF